MKYLSLFISLIIAAGAYGATRDYKETRKVIDSILEEAPDRKAPADGKGRETSGKKTPADRDARDQKKQKDTASFKTNVEEQMLFKSAFDLYNGGFYDGALQKIGELKTKFPQSAFADQSRVLSARILNRQYKHDEAIRELSSVKPDSGEFRQALYLKGESFQLKGDPVNALDNFQRLYSQYPEDPLANIALLASARILHAQHRGQQALDAAVRLIKDYGQKETVDDAYYLMGKIYETDPVLRDIESARRVYRIFLKKAQGEDERFSKSPLRERVSKDLQRLEKNHFKLEN